MSPIRSHAVPGPVPITGKGSSEFFLLFGNLSIACPVYRGKLKALSLRAGNRGDDRSLSEWARRALLGRPGNARHSLNDDRVGDAAMCLTSASTCPAFTPKSGPFAYTRTRAPDASRSAGCPRPCLLGKRPGRALAKAGTERVEDATLCRGIFAFRSRSITRQAN